MVIEERSIENESQVQMLTNYHQRIKIKTRKSKSKTEKKQIQQYLNYGSKL